MLDITNGVNMTNKITEGIEFGDLVSRNEGMWLIDRSAPTPSEKTVTDSVPFMQGEYDFSMIMGERVFDNRPISYTFHIYERENSLRKFNQTIMENRLMSQGVIQLKDSYSPGYYYVGKCVSVDTEDDHVYGRLVVSIEFDCYPFKIKEAAEGSPYWDDYDVSDYYQENEFTISGSKTISFMNVGAAGISPRIISSAAMVLKKSGMTVNVPAGKSNFEDFRFEIGMNSFTATGNGTIKFEWHKEVI